MSEQQQKYISLARELLGHEVGYCECEKCRRTAQWLKNYTRNVINDVKQSQQNGYGDWRDIYG